MSDERKQILKMLADGKIGVDEAERLLEAVADSGDEETEHPEHNHHHHHHAEGRCCNPKYLRVVVEPKADSTGYKHKKVNIKIPIMLIKAGMKLGAVLPEHARERIDGKLKESGLNVDLKNLDSETLDEVMKALQTMSIDVDEDDERVKVYCE